MSTFLWPTVQRYVSSGFNEPRYYGPHNAIDIPAPIGAPASAAAAGKVHYAAYFGDCGLNVQIETTDAWRLHYCHLSVIRVSRGQNVAAGQRIGDVGSTGISMGPHLHFGLYSPGELPGSRYVSIFNKWAVDPLLYLGRRKEIDMFILRATPSGAIYLVGSHGKRHLFNWDEINLYAAAGLPSIETTDAKAGAIPNA